VFIDLAAGKDLKDPMAMTYLDDKLYVIWQRKCHRIAVYKVKKSIKRRKRLNLYLSGNCHWLASCKVNNRLYVTDENCVCVVNIGEDHAIVKWEMDKQPRSLSVTSSGNVLVVFESTFELREYDHEGNEVRAITIEPARNVVSLGHAVASGNENLLYVSCVETGGKHGICYVSLTRGATECEGDESSANSPMMGDKPCELWTGHSEKYHTVCGKGIVSSTSHVLGLVAIGDGNVIFADSKKNQIHQLTFEPSIYCKQINLPTELKKPKIVCLDEGNKRMYVVEKNTNRPKKFKIGIVNCIFFSGQPD
jgi:hypothetical protein